MCGIAGIVSLDGSEVNTESVSVMTDAIAHRGPDGSGVWVSGCAGLGHRRLSIIDLSSAASQPMFNEDGNVALTFNGEIYNYRCLRRELESAGHQFRSQSDTETIVHGYEEWGLECLKRLNGM